MALGRRGELHAVALESRCGAFLEDLGVGLADVVARDHLLEDFVQGGESLPVGDPQPALRHGA